MLHPRLRFGLGPAITLAGLLSTLPTGSEGVSTGVPVGLALVVASQPGEGEQGTLPLEPSAIRVHERTRQGDRT